MLPAVHRMLLVAGSCGLFGCGGAQATLPAPPTFTGTFALQSANGQTLPVPGGLGSRRGLIGGPADTVFYSDARYTLTAPSGQFGNLNFSRSLIYRYRPIRADTTQTETGEGVWTKEGDVYTLKYFGLVDTVTLDANGSGFTVRYGPTGFLPTGVALRYARISP